MNQMTFRIGDTDFTIDGQSSIVTTGRLSTYWVELCPERTLHDIMDKYYRDGDVIIADDFFKSRTVWDGRQVLFLEAHEHNKTIDTVMRLISALPSSFSKSNRLLIVGGGITQDVGGFLAAIFKRGIPYILIPTTLLAMTDSCIGSKVCLNHGSKNRLGLFNPPAGVILSGAELSTLSDDMVRSGLGESLKLALIGGWDAWHEFIRLWEEGRIMDIVMQSLRIKKAVIEADEYELNERRALNYGHTVGHAIEASSGFEIPHGIAVMLGIIHVNLLFGMPWVDIIHPIINKIIPDRYLNRRFDIDVIMHHLSQDKKNRGSDIGFVVLDEPGMCSFRWIPFDQTRTMFLSQGKIA